MAIYTLKMTGPNTINDPVRIFRNDPARILRGIRLIVMEGFRFSGACLAALNLLFEGQNNLFDAASIELKPLIRHVKRLFHEKKAQNYFWTPIEKEENSIAILHDLGLLHKLIAGLGQHNDPTSGFYFHELQKLAVNFQMKMMEHLSQPVYSTVTPINNSYSPFFMPHDSSSPPSNFNPWIGYAFNPEFN